jgi:AAA family ATP:ADP antiporter
MRFLADIPLKRVAAAFWIALAASFLLFGYEFIRSVSQSLYIGAYGAARLPVVMAAAPLGTLLVIVLYGRLLSLAGPRRAILLTTLLSAGLILACAQAIRGGSRVATGVLYVFREAYIVLLVEQVWSFINSTLCQGEGRKLNGPICGVASLGAIAGGLVVNHLAIGLGSVNLLVLAAGSLVPTGLCAVLAYRRGGEPQPAAAEARGRQGHLGLRPLLQSRVLRDLALIVMATQVVSTVLDLQVSRYVEAALPLRDERTRWFGGFYAVLNIGAAAFQFILAPLLLARLRLRVIHVTIPLVHGTLCVAALVWPSLTAAAAALMMFKVLDYSLFRAAKELVYVPLSFDARYRAKELIDAFGYRLAKGGASLGLVVANRLMTVPAVALPGIALVALAAWIPLAVQLTAGRPPAGRPASPEGL